jgi:hypothetical protein
MASCCKNIVTATVLRVGTTIVLGRAFGEHDIITFLIHRSKVEKGTNS